MELCLNNMATFFITKTKILKGNHAPSREGVALKKQARDWQLAKAEATLNPFFPQRRRFYHRQTAYPADDIKMDC